MKKERRRDKMLLGISIADDVDRRVKNLLHLWV